MTLVAQKHYQAIEHAQSPKAFGADYVVIVDGFPTLTYNIMTSALPILKNEQVEVSSTRGVKSVIKGYQQTHNILPMTLSERVTSEVHNVIQDIIASEDNGSLLIAFFNARDVQNAELYGYLRQAIIFQEDNPEADIESSTSVATTAITVTGHYQEVPLAKRKIKYDITQGFNFPPL